ncbi:integrase arm-type DNA-binding domain-containing protein [Sulfurivirga sp.]|uniref:tyrosine-type recombinase/integrase n=1 Tax=Sulfurivirga sp. TaxID=2614236 RepID=UPI0025D80B4B|nr:integrase arm-type DNA-binding domain-containing protein [Sulfurivirga sp.]
MPKQTVPLTDARIRKAKPKEKAYTLYDGDGLELHIRPSGSKRWRFRYYRPDDGRRTMMSLGAYPDVSLQQAREMAAEQRGLLAQGIDPVQHRDSEMARLRAEKETQRRETNPTFSELFERWYREREKQWKPAHARDIWQRMEKHILPYLGAVPVRELTIQQFLEVLKRIEATGRVETMKRVLQYCNGVMRYGVTFGLCPANPLNDLDRSVFRKAEKGNYPHTTDPAILRQILRAIDEYAGDMAVRSALQLQPHVFLRPRELAHMRWEEVNFEAGQIEIPAERMKKKRDHVVPMSQWVRARLEELYGIYGEVSPYVFPSPRSMHRPISEQSLNAGLNRMGFKGIQSAHGFRHTASTLLNERGYNSEWVEMQLAHVDRNTVRGTYNKAQHLAGRRQMMEDWSQWLLSLKESAKVVPIFRQA